MMVCMELGAALGAAFGAPAASKGNDAQRNALRRMKERGSGTGTVLWFEIRESLGSGV
jgi:hypothetical protein